MISMCKYRYRFITLSADKLWFISASHLTPPFIKTQLWLRLSIIRLVVRGGRRRHITRAKLFSTGCITRKQQLLINVGNKK